MVKFTVIKSALLCMIASLNSKANLCSSDKPLIASYRLNCLRTTPMEDVPDPVFESAVSPGVLSELLLPSLESLSLSSALLLDLA